MNEAAIAAPAVRNARHVDKERPPSAEAITTRLTRLGICGGGGRLTTPTVPAAWYFSTTYGVAIGIPTL
jgi:hypothetical protein